jgi:hypothetical protein
LTKELEAAISAAREAGRVLRAPFFVRSAWNLIAAD